MPFYVSSSLFSCSFIFPCFVGESSSSVESCFSSDWSCSASFFFAFLVLICLLALLLLLLLIILFCCLFFLFLVLVFPLLLLLLCLEEQTAMVAFFLAALLCGVFFDPPSRMDLRRQNAKGCTLFLGTFAFKPLFKKNLLPPVFGVLFWPFCFIKASFCAFFNKPQNESGRVKRYKNRHFSWPTGGSNKAALGFYVFGFSCGRNCASTQYRGGNFLGGYFRRPFQLRISAPFLHLWIPKSGPAFEAYSIYIIYYI